MTQQAVDDWLRANKNLVIFPEGTMNRNPYGQGFGKFKRPTSGEPIQVGPFRHGGMKMAIDHQTALFAVAIDGAQDMWPPMATPKCMKNFGGYPSTIRMKFEKVHDNAREWALELLNRDYRARQQLLQQMRHSGLTGQRKFKNIVIN